MSRYQVIARRWRPKSFNEVVGQRHVVNTLKSAIERGKIAHAYLFSGPRGVGKTSMARILAKALNCEKGPTPEPCCECENCREIERGIFVDVIEMDAASNRGIDEIRELRESVRYAPTKGRYKVYIIDEVHMLTEQAFNALLKTLEEPPSHVVFVFATTEYRKIPQTILSRCIRFDFKPLTEDEAVEILSNICDAEGVEYEEAALRAIARAASGSLRDAEMFLEQVIAYTGGKIKGDAVYEALGLVEEEALENFLKALVERDVEPALHIFHKRVVERGYDVAGFVQSLLEFIGERLKKQALSGDTADAVKLYTFFKTFLELSEKVKRHPFPDMLVEAEIIRLTALPPLEDIKVLLDVLEGKARSVSPSFEKRGEKREAVGEGRAKPASYGADADALADAVSRRDKPLSLLLKEADVRFKDGAVVISPGKLGEVSWGKLREKEDVIKEQADALGLGVKFENSVKKAPVVRNIREEAAENPVVREILSVFDNALIVDVKKRGEV